jgi:predicted double-glycine peptidase
MHRRDQRHRAVATLLRNLRHRHALAREVLLRMLKERSGVVGIERVKRTVDR